MSGKFRATRIVVAGFTLCCLMTVAETASAQIFEFVDDFRKPWEAQRDPWEERIETERHDFTQSAVTVGRGVRQVELGYSYFLRNEGELSENSHTGPEMLVRYGLSEDIEFRVRWNYVWQFFEEEEDLSGGEDMRLAFKFQMTRAPEFESGEGGEGEGSEGTFYRSWMPTSALDVRITVPSAGDPFSTDRVEFGMDYIYQWALSERATIAGSTRFGSNAFGDFGFTAEDPAEDYFMAYGQSVVFGYELGPRNTIYSEWFGVFSDGREDEITTSTYNLGIDHYISPNCVIDIRAGWGLNDDSDDFFTGIGGGFRF